MIFLYSPSRPAVYSGISAPRKSYKRSFVGEPAPYLAFSDNPIMEEYLMGFKKVCV